MQEIKGKITAIENDVIRIAVEDEEQCHACGLKDNCKNTTLTLDRTADTQQLHNGQDVLVSFGNLLKTSALLYMFPLFSFFGGIALTTYLVSPENELVMFLGGVIALALALLVVKVFSPRLNKDQYKIKIKPLK